MHLQQPAGMQRKQVVNAYDNSIVQTDHFLDSVLNWLWKPIQIKRKQL
jgi:glucan phosphoethanolaminetransferase (alkaline phosphatase superfamily)